jgi:hypothetical protein
MGTRQLRWLLQLSQLVNNRAITSGRNQTAGKAFTTFTAGKQRAVPSRGNQTAEMAVTAFTQLLNNRVITSGGNQTAEMAGGAEQSTIPAANSSQFLLSFLITERGEERQYYSIVFIPVRMGDEEKIKTKRREQRQPTLS